VEIVDQDLLPQIPQKYARIIGGKREGASSRESIMEVREMLKNTLGTLKNHWERSPFYMESQNGRWGHFPLVRVISGPKIGSTGPKTENTRKQFCNFSVDFRFKPSSEPAENSLTKNAITFTSGLGF
jgi:hypothetical protein